MARTKSTVETNVSEPLEIRTEIPRMHEPIMPQPERQGALPVPTSARYPRVIGGICEYCGVIDKNQPSEVQYKLCPHYKNIGQLRCSYCDELQDPVAVVGHHSMNIAAHPDNPAKLVVWCGSYNCSEAHRKRFSPSQK